MRIVELTPFRRVPSLKPSKRSISMSTAFSSEQLEDLVKGFKLKLDKYNYLILSPKLDGVRASLHKKGSRIDFFSDEEKKFPINRLKIVVDEIMASALPESCILDGELYLQGTSGISSQGHQAIAGYLHSRQTPEKKVIDKLRYNYWDILYKDGHDISSLPLSERLKRLPKIKKLHFGYLPWMEIKPDYKVIRKAMPKISTPEGLMIKSPEGTYWEPTKIGKIKYVMDIDVEVGQVIPRTSGNVYACFIKGQKESVGLTYKTQYLKDIKRGDVLRVMLTKMYAKKRPDGSLVYHWYSPTPRDPQSKSFIYKQMAGGKQEKREPGKRVDNVEYAHQLWSASGKIIKGG